MSVVPFVAEAPEAGLLVHLGFVNDLHDGRHGASDVNHQAGDQGHHKADLHVSTQRPLRPLWRSPAEAGVENGRQHEGDGANEQRSHERHQGSFLRDDQSHHACQGHQW